MAVSLVVTLSIFLSLSCVRLQAEMANEGRAAAPSVVLKQGKVTGVLQKSDSGRDYSAFFGIPYGTIPKRFMPAEAAGPFLEDFVANKKSQMCTQIGVGPNEVSGTEDCLTLQVYTPHVPEAETDKKLAVMVWIYGGAFVFGSASPSMYGANHLMEHDILLVAMNYRLGILGFLGTGDAASPGNYGLLDQNLALQWVQENIEMFGGDKNRVTIFGESAGAASVVFQILSPLSFGLFHNAIAMSGSAICPWTLNEKPLEMAKQVAAIMNCSMEDTYELIECLRTVDATLLFKSAIAAGILAAPVVEPENGGLFLTEHPYRVLLEGRFNNVTLMSGVCLDEFATPMLYQNDPSKYNMSREEFLERKLPKMLEDVLKKNLSKDELDNIRAIGQEYFGDIDFDNETAKEIAEIQLLSDFSFVSPNDMTIELMTSHGVPVYSYVFEYTSAINNPTHINGRADVSHASELPYLFNMKILTMGRSYSEDEKEFVKKLVNLWTNFAITSNPTPTGELVWERTPGAGVDNHFMRLGTEMELGVNPHPNRIALWNNLLTTLMKTTAYS